MLYAKKLSITFLFILLGFWAMPNNSLAQDQTTQVQQDSTQTYVITKNDGAQYIGRIISQNAREVVIETEKLGKIVIPKHEIKSIEKYDPSMSSIGGTKRFGTRYFITTNGLPVKKGESYVQWNLFGPDFQFALGDQFGAGIMTTWLGVPVIGTAKYNINLGKKLNLGIGTMLGTFSWANPSGGFVLPFGAVTYGDYDQNINFSAGYGAIWADGDSDSRMLYSIGGMTKISEKIGLVFDSIIIPIDQSEVFDQNVDNIVLLIPGIRWYKTNDSVFQFGFAGLRAEGEFAPFPLPMVQWYKTL
jgi:hypothetical protein